MGPVERFDRDHAFWTESHWTSTKEASALRSMGSLVIRLDRYTHEQKHKSTPPIPLLGFHTLRRTLATYEPGRTPIQSIENVQRSIENASAAPRMHEIERQQAALAVWALELGKPYWEQSPDQPKPMVL